MSTLSKIGWGSYTKYSGPWFKGSVPYLIPQNPTFLDKVTAVITATEGGMRDAANFYDRCVCTMGVIQWGEVCANRAVSQIVHDARRSPENAWIDDRLAEANLRFSPLRPWLQRADNPAADVAHTFLDSDGESWTSAQRAYAKRSAAAMVDIFADPRTYAAQDAFTQPRLLGFAFGAPRQDLFTNMSPDDQEGWAGAARAIYISFAANLPTVASKHGTAALSISHATDKDEAITLARMLTFNPGIAIYPGRYDKIRPVVERLFGVDLPDFASELRTWKANQPHLDRFPTVASWQAALEALGFDLGPQGADGKDGPKTRLAVKMFQKMHNLTADGLVGKQTLAKLAELTPDGF